MIGSKEICYKGKGLNIIKWSHSIVRNVQVFIILYGILYVNRSTLNKIMFYVQCIGSLPKGTVFPISLPPYIYSDHINLQLSDLVNVHTKEAIYIEHRMFVQCSSPNVQFPTQ